MYSYNILDKKNLLLTQSTFISTAHEKNNSIVNVKIKHYFT